MEDAGDQGELPSTRSPRLAAAHADEWATARSQPTPNDLASWAERFRAVPPTLHAARSLVSYRRGRARRLLLPLEIRSAQAVQLGLQSLTKRHVRLRVLVQGGESDLRSFFALCQRGADEL